MSEYPSLLPEIIESSKFTYNNNEFTITSDGNYDNSIKRLCEYNFFNHSSGAQEDKRWQSVNTPPPIGFV